MDDIAREYLLIAIALGELEDGIVDSYYGPAEIRDEARAVKSTPAELRTRAHELRARLSDITDAQRARWLDRQLLALETLAGQLDGKQLPYRELVERCFDAAPEATPADEYERVRAELERLLPGDGNVRERLEAHDAALTVPVSLLAGIVEWLTDELRAAAGQAFFVPAGEDLTISLVRNEPWGAYNWYDGDLHSRIEVNTDLPMRAPRLMDLLAHEGFPGHHLEHATKEARLVREQRRFESSVQLINTPEAYISEGLADTGVRFVAPEERWQELLLEICERAGIPMTRDEARLNWQIGRTLQGLHGAQGDAALQLHADGRSVAEVVSFLERNALATPERAHKMLEFITHPLWRAYVFCYAGGERLLTAWIEQAGDAEGERERFGRLLSEQLTPSGIALEMAVAG
ncbi:MAG TPA: hypothetical protein VIK08_09785 [Candidatus Limnocylindrales bacterium]